MRNLFYMLLSRMKVGKMVVLHKLGGTGGT